MTQIKSKFLRPLYPMMPLNTGLLKDITKLFLFSYEFLWTVTVTLDLHLHNFEEIFHYQQDDTNI